MNTFSITSMRLINQQLVNADFKTPGELVSWMGAIQSQDFTMGKWAIGVRLPGITDKEVEEAMNRGEFVRTHILRPTWHFVAAEDIYWMLELSSPRLRVGCRTYDKMFGITDEQIVKTNSLITKLLDKEPNQTRQEIAEKLQAEGVLGDNDRLYYTMFRAEMDGIICNGVPKGRFQTYDLLEKKVPKPISIIGKEESLYKLAYKYFRSHGPATLQDFIWWSGLKTTDARKAIELIKSDFLSETIENQTYIFHESCAGYKPESDMIHFLPAFDETFVSYKDRKEILALEHHKKVIVSNGVFQPTISRNGEVIGTWRRATGKKQIVINTNYIYKPTKKLEKLIKKATDELCAFYK